MKFARLTLGFLVSLRAGFHTILFLVSRPFQEAQDREIRPREGKVIDP